MSMNDLPKHWPGQNTRERLGIVRFQGGKKIL